MKIQVKFNIEQVCKDLLAQKLDNLNIRYRLEGTGEIDVLEPLNEKEQEVLLETLNSGGVEVVNNHQMIIVNKIKQVIREVIHSDTYDSKYNLSEYLEQKLPYSYVYLSQIFSELTYLTIEKYVILKKIDYVKELLLENELSLSEIAFKLGYSNVAHLSNQFKKTTGFSPSSFTKLKLKMKTNK